MSNEKMPFDELFATEGSPRWNQMVDDVVDKATTIRNRELESKGQLYVVAWPFLAAAAVLFVVAWGMVFTGVNQSFQEVYSTEEVATAHRLIELSHSSETPTDKELIQLIGGTYGNE